MTLSTYGSWPPSGQFSFNKSGNYVRPDLLDTGGPTANESDRDRMSRVLSSVDTRDSNRSRLKKNPLLVRAHSNRGESHAALTNVLHVVQVMVDTNEMITLIDSGAGLAAEIQTVVKTQPPAGTKSAGDTAAVDTAASQSASDPLGTAGKGEHTPDGDSCSNEKECPQKTSALVVFSVPTQLKNLNKGDRLNASFKPLAPSQSDPHETQLDCTATGEVQEKKFTSDSGVEVRVGLTLTLTQGGERTDRKLDLLLTDRSKDAGNAHYGVLEAPQFRAVGASMAGTRFRKP
jgi:hypothetical protein